MTLIVETVIVAVITTIVTITTTFIIQRAIKWCYNAYLNRNEIIDDFNVNNI